MLHELIADDRKVEAALMAEGSREAQLEEDLLEAKEIAMGKSDVKPVARHFEALARERARLLSR